MKIIHKGKKFISPVDMVDVYEYGECNIFYAIENNKYHISVACKDRYPTWDEIVYIREQLTPNNVTMAMILPPEKNYINIHNNCFHLWQIEDKK